MENQKQPESWFSKIYSLIKEGLMFGAEDRDHVNFTWTKYFLRTITLNLLAAFIAWRVTMSQFQGQLNDNSAGTGSMSNSNSNAEL